jgi:hypothetical protein
MYSTLQLNYLGKCRAYEESILDITGMFHLSPKLLHENVVSLRQIFSQIRAETHADFYVNISLICPI